MTYGIELQNEYSENLVDIVAGLTYYKKSSGTGILCDVQTSGTYLAPWSTTLRSNNGCMPTFTKLASNPLTLIDDKMTFAGLSWKTIILRDTQSGVSPANRTCYYAEPVSTNKDDLIFFKMPTEGIIGLMHIWWPFTGLDDNGDAMDVGLCAMCCPAQAWTGTTGLEYQVVSTDLPAQTTDWGVQVFDDDGTTVLFDTSREIASFGDHFTITAAQAQDVIDNDATITITLRKSIPNAWISCEGGGGASYKSVFNSTRNTLYLLNIKQTSNTQITISRETLLGGNLNWAANTFTNYEDATFIVADFN